MSTPQEIEILATQTLGGMKGLALGAPFLGICFDSLLMGVIICQMTHWIPMARQDPRHVRIIVGTIFTAALLGSAFTWATYMTAFVFEYGQYSRFASLEYLGWYGTLDILIVVPVQIFFAERAVRINANNIFLIAACTILITATGVMGIATTVATRGENIFTRTMLSVRIATAWPGVCILTHVFLTSSILWGLYRTRSLAGRANRLVTRIIVVSIESQLPSTIVALLIMLVLFIDYQSPLIPFIVVVHPKIFAVGALAMVNLRHSMKNSGKVVVSFGSSESSSRGQGVHISLGSTVTDIGPCTPKADFDNDHLSRQQSTTSMMESGMALHELTMDSEKNSQRNYPFKY